MNEKTKKLGLLSPLPDFLEVSISKGIVDERVARRIELYRRTRGLGKYKTGSALMNDPPDPHLTFDNYLVCKGNSFAVELARTVALKSPSRLPYNPLYIYGDVGLGKTHLLSAIANLAKDKEVLLVNTADLETELERAERLKARAELTDWLASVDVLLVDDIQLCEGRENLQRNLFSVLNYMTKTHRWVVISSDVPPTRLADMESRLLSRLGGGVIVSLQMGDKTERRDLVRHFLDERSMPQDVVDYLAENISDNVRRLKAAVSQLLVLNESTETPVTIDVVQSIVPSPGRVSHSGKEGDVAYKIESPEAQAAAKADSLANRFKEMFKGAVTKEEQALALQMAVGERLGQLRNEQGDPETILQLEKALELLREGRMEEAIRSMTT